MGNRLVARVSEHSFPVRHLCDFRSEELQTTRLESEIEDLEIDFDLAGVRSIRPIFEILLRLWSSHRSHRTLTLHRSSLGLVRACFLETHGNLTLLHFQVFFIIRHVFQIRDVAAIVPRLRSTGPWTNLREKEKSVE